jgi:hypothetical protein
MARQHFRIERKVEIRPRVAARPRRADSGVSDQSPAPAYSRVHLGVGERLSGTFPCRKRSSRHRFGNQAILEKTLLRQITLEVGVELLLYVGLVEVLVEDEAGGEVVYLGDVAAGEMIDGGLDGFVAHLEGMLHDQ